MFDWERGGGGDMLIIRSKDALERRGEGASPWTKSFHVITSFRVLSVNMKTALLFLERLRLFDVLLFPVLPFSHPHWTVLVSH